jgi:hypothetical protein
MVERGVKHHKPLPKTSITEPGSSHNVVLSTPCHEWDSNSQH